MVSEAFFFGDKGDLEASSFCYKGGVTVCLKISILNLGSWAS